MDTTIIIGSVGATLILITFFLNQFHKLSNDSLIYDVINFIGGVLLLIYSILLDSVPFMVVNAVWSIVSLKDIITDLGRDNK
ncbi:MAG: hypothetical protein Q8O87_01675 [bacterium]|nr:hypothetical protein [bacterium]